MGMARVGPTDQVWLSRRFKHPGQRYCAESVLLPMATRVAGNPGIGEHNRLRRGIYEQLLVEREMGFPCPKGQSSPTRAVFRGSYTMPGL
jgi:hypothetical protein